MGQRRVHVERGVGAALQLPERDDDRVRTAEAAGIDRHRKAHEPELEELAPRLFETRWGGDLAVLEPAPNAIAAGVHGRAVLVHEAQALIDGGVALGLRHVRKALVLEQLLDLQMLVEREADGAEI